MMRCRAWTSPAPVAAAREAGFTMLELIVIIGALAILAAAVAPSMLQQIAQSRIDATREEAIALYEAMVGRPAEGASFGFVGDIGRLPNDFSELAQRGGLPFYTTATYRSIGMGWRGPYINFGASGDDFLTDAFGRPYTGASTGQVRSAGPDGAFNTEDDIVYPPNPPVITGDVTVTVKTMEGQKVIVDPLGYRVELYFASDGSESSVTATSAPFTFEQVPMGIHAIRVLDAVGTIVSQDTIVVRPNATTAVELWF